MTEPLQPAIQFPVRKRATPGRRKIVANVDEEEKENSPTKKMQIEKPTRKMSVTTRSRKVKNSIKMELESIIQTLDILSPSPDPEQQPATEETKQMPLELEPKFSEPKAKDVTVKEEEPVDQSNEAKPEEGVEGAEIPSNHEEAPKVVASGIDYKKTKQALHTSIPDWLVGRKSESDEITAFLVEHAENRMPGSIYISGAPGTGKTAVLMKTIEALKVRCIKVVVNCMTHKNSQSIFTAIKLSLTESAGKKGGAKKTSASSREVATDIEEFVTTSEVPIVMVFDEIDSLDSRNQEVLYTIFEWPALESSRLILVGVANSLDLTDRILPRLLSRKRCKPKLLNFPPYSREEIARIILERLAKLGSASALDPLSVHFCARKLSSMSGDLRMALDVCRRAVDVVEMEEKRNPHDQADPTQKPKKVGLSVIQKVVNEVYGQKVVAKSESRLTVPLQQMLAICTLLLMGRSTKSSKEVNFAKFHESYTKVCKKNGVTEIERSEFLSLCTSMQDQGLVNIKKAKEVRLYKVSLRIDERELESSIQDRTLLSTVLSKGLD